MRLDIRDDDFQNKFAALLEARRERAEDVEESVEAILSDVRRRGDDAVLDYTRRFDDPTADLARLRLSKAEIAAAWAQCSPGTLAALDLAAARIRSFHEHQRPTDLDIVDPEGVRLGWRWSAIEAVGLYVPGGTAAYPSSVLMNAIPAKVAGCRRLVMVVPAPGGQIAPLVLAAARIAQVDEVWRIGGAQAIGALAYGTGHISSVHKIVGPGNAYVAAAKRRVFGRVGIDMIAGPSEVLIVADAANDPSWIAYDLLAQAEHDAAAQSILITDDRDFADAVAAWVDRHLLTLPRHVIAQASWRNHGCIIVVEKIDQAAPLINLTAPEHLQLAVQNPDALLAHVVHAGSIFLGRFTPEALGDYIAGPNHVLPTGRSARFSSGLGVLDFMKRSTFLGCDMNGLTRLGPPTIALAEAEGLRAHARSVSIRMNLGEEP